MKRKIQGIFLLLVFRRKNLDRIIVITFAHMFAAADCIFSERNKAMKKILSFAAAVSVAAAVCLSAFSSGFDRTVVIGDSIASGYGLDGYVFGDNYSAKDSFANRLSSDCETLSNFAVDGRTSAELLDALSSDMAADISAADSVIVSIGGNDFLRPMITALQTALLSDEELFSQLMSGEFDMSKINQADLIARFSDVVCAAAEQVDIGQTKLNLAAITDEIRSANPDCDIYILTVYNPFGGDENLGVVSEVAEKKLAELNGAIKSLKGVKVVDVYSAFDGSAEQYTNITEADIHPNAAGHQLIYTLISESSTAEVFAPSGDNPSKGSPDTGVTSVAAVFAVAGLGAAAAVFARKRHCE